MGHVMAEMFARKHRMSQYRDRYGGRPAAVLGGGPSLPADMQKLPPGCLLIAVNYHALLLCKPDFMVYNDHPEGQAPKLKDAILRGDVFRVSPEPSSDIQFDVDVWTGSYSSNTATWFALWLGCDPVILCGMDCYQGDRAYFHEYEDMPHFHYPLDHHIRPWIEDAKNMLPGWERIRAMSGPLMNVFGAYETISV
jgi:hypothetical protein